MQLPMWIIAARTGQGTSSRPAPRVRPNWEKEKRDWRWDQHRSKTPTVSDIKSTRLKAYNNGPLGLNEYRFWRSAGTDGMCRCCLAVVKGVDERRVHQRNLSCTVKMTEAYKLLLRDRKCVVCDVETTQTKWGIPLCKAMCVARWQFEAGAGAAPLRQALEVVRLKLWGKAL